MGLEVKVSAEEQSGSFLAFDCTGKHSSDNPGGYGGPNYSSSKIVKSTLFVMGPNDSGYIHEIDVTNSLPNSEELGFEVFPSSIGQTDELESGRYKFKLVHEIMLPSTSTTTREGYGVEVFTKNIQCCIDKLKIDTCKNAFRDEKQKKILELHNLMDSVEFQIEAGLYDEANTTIDYLKSQCKCNGCK